MLDILYRSEMNRCLAISAATVQRAMMGGDGFPETKKKLFATFWTNYDPVDIPKDPSGPASPSFGFCI